MDGVAHPGPTRSWLFVPGDNARFIEKATEVPADCVIYDLEDAVAAGAKELARTRVAEAVRRRPRQRCYVRVNAVSSPWHDADVETVAVVGPEGLCLPKAEQPSEVLALSRRLEDLERGAGLAPGSVRLVLCLESPLAVLGALELARCDTRIVGLMLGSEDLSLCLGLGTARTGAAGEFVFARSMVAYAAAAGGLTAIDGVFPDLSDDAGLERDARFARELGFSAKATIHPRQVPVVNAVFSPRAEEVEAARRVVEAFEAASGRGEGALALDGQLVDRPIVERARRVLSAAAEPGTNREVDRR